MAPKQWELDWMAAREAERKRVTEAAKAAGRSTPTICWTRLVMVKVAAPGEALSVVKGEERRPLIFLCELLTGKFIITIQTKKKINCNYV
jgi:hypothetical protein